MMVTLTFDELKSKYYLKVFNVKFKEIFKSQNHKARSSRPEMFCKKVYRNFAKFTGKHLCQSLFFNKVAGLRPTTLLKRRPATLSKERIWHSCFPVNFEKFLRTPFVSEHLLWLLLNISFSITI